MVALGILLGAMSPERLQAVNDLIEMIAPDQVHQLEGAPCSSSLGALFIYGTTSGPSSQCMSVTTPGGVDIHAVGSPPINCAGYGACYEIILRRCNVFVGSFEGCALARAIKPMATYFEVE